MDKSLVLLYLTMETQPISETSCFFKKKLDAEQSPKKEDCIRELQ